MKSGCDALIRCSLDQKRWPHPLFHPHIFQEIHHNSEEGILDSRGSSIFEQSIRRRAFILEVAFVSIILNEVLKAFAFNEPAHASLGLPQRTRLNTQADVESQASERREPT